MTRDDILRMADEAYELAKKDLLNGDYLTTGFLAIRDIHFHRLATAAEREACAEVCEEIKCKMWEEYKKHRETRFQDACDGAEVCENAIRARGNE
jgi:hypothetical protein